MQVKSREEQASKFLKSIGWQVSYEDTESAARSVAEAAQNQIDELREEFQVHSDKQNLRIAELKSNGFQPITPFMHYASAALTGLITGGRMTNENGGLNYEDVARWASGYAAAMIRQHHPKNIVEVLNSRIAALEKDLAYCKANLKPLP